MLFSLLKADSYVIICVTLYVHNWLVCLQEDRVSEIGHEAEGRDSILTMHTCFLIKSLSQREDHIRDIAENLLTQLRDRFPQVNFQRVCMYVVFLVSSIWFSGILYILRLNYIFAGFMGFVLFRLIAIFISWRPFFRCHQWPCLDINSPFFVSENCPGMDN
jgi:hypothetical protein